MRKRGAFGKRKRFSLSIKLFYPIFQLSRGSAHEIQSAQQIDKNREHVSRFLYFEREKVSAWELSDVRVLRSQNTDCRKNVSFSTGSNANGFVRCLQFRGRKEPIKDEKSRNGLRLIDIIEREAYN